jgi:hypothetical protein
MKNIKLIYLLGILVAVHALLRAMDGFTGEDVFAILIFVVFALLFRLFSGIKNLDGIIRWSQKRRTRSVFLLIAIVLVGIQALWRSYVGDFKFVFAVATTIEAALVFATCLVFGVWLKEKTLHLLIWANLMSSKEFNSNSSKPKE